MKCPRCKKEPAIIDSVFGILPGLKCQKEDAKWSFRKPPEFYSLNRMDRIQRQRDKHLKDMLPIFERNKASAEFAKAFPVKAREYYTKEELSKL